MIQRIQSVYLFLVAVLMIVVAFIPLGFYVGEDGATSTLKAWGLEMIQDGNSDICAWGLMAIALLAAIIAVATIFLFKNRPLQIRLTWFNVLVLVGWYVVLAIFIMKYDELLVSASFHCALGASFPAVSVILSILALRAIRKDECLVKAADRLR